MQSKKESHLKWHWITIKYEDRDIERQKITCPYCEKFKCSFLVTVPVDDDEDDCIELPMCITCAVGNCPDNPRRIINLLNVEIQKDTQ